MIDSTNQEQKTQESICVYTRLTRPPTQMLLLKLKVRYLDKYVYNAVWMSFYFSCCLIVDFLKGDI